MPESSTPFERFATVREAMIREQIESRGIRNARTLEAIRSVPRELFVPAESELSAYDDRALPIDCDQTISQPYIVAYMTDALQVKPGHRVLEVGTGSGYQTAVLARLADRVDTIERHSSLANAAATRLRGLGIENVHIHVGDGSLGWDDEAPFDRIVVTATAPSVPTRLVEQLVDGGLLVMPVGEQDHQRMIVECKDATRLVERVLIPCRFVRLVGQEGWSG